MNKKEKNNLNQNNNNKKYKNNKNNKTTIAGCDTIEINLVILNLTNYRLLKVYLKKAIFCKIFNDKCKSLTVWIHGRIQKKIFWKVQVDFSHEKND